MTELRVGQAYWLVDAFEGKWVSREKRRRGCLKRVVFAGIWLSTQQTGGWAYLLLGWCLI